MNLQTLITRLSLPSLPGTQISDLDRGSLEGLLLQACKIHRDVSMTVEHVTARRVRTEQARVTTFDHFSKSAWKAINVDYSSMKGSNQFDMAGNVIQQIEGYIKTIRGGCSWYASFGMKENGLETLRKIGKTICLSGGDVIANEVQQHFQCKSHLEGAMMDIVQSMTIQEQEDLIKRAGKPEGEWYDKIVDLEVLAQGRCVFDGLADLIAFLDGQDYWNEAGDYDEEEDEDDEGEGEGVDGDEEDVEIEEIEPPRKRRIVRWQTEDLLDENGDIDQSDPNEWKRRLWHNGIALEDSQESCTDVND